MERIASAACDEPAPTTIEIGPGKGALTERLLARSERVIAIELDADLVAYLEQKFRGEPRLTLLSGDVLQIDLGQWGSATITGNLPYYIATPIIERVLALGLIVRQAVFLVQKEVAERLTASPGHSQNGFLTVKTALFAEAELLFTVKPSAFHPPPKVDSAVVRLRPLSRAADLEIQDPAGFLAFAGRCFRQKRKTIRNNLAGVYGREAVDKLPEARLRAEQLSLEQLAGMYSALKIAGRS